MKQTKKIGKIVTLTVLTVALLFYLLPNVTLIEQSMEIKTTPDKVFELINQPDKWKEWYTPLQDEMGVQMRFTGPAQGKGAGFQWVSKNPDQTGGTMNIRNSKNNRMVSAVIELNDRHSYVMSFKIKPVKKNASLLTITSRLQFPQDSLLHYLQMMFDRSEELAVIDYIENISEVAVEKAEGIAIHLQRINSFTYISITDSCKWNDISKKMSGLYKDLMVFVARSDLSMTNRPIAIYHQVDDKQVVFEVGIPVDKEVQGAGKIQCKTMPAGNNVVADYYGSYDTLEDGHNAIQQWLERYRRTLRGYPWEIYVTDPTTEQDPNKWLTRIFYPVD